MAERVGTLQIRAADMVDTLPEWALAPQIVNGRANSVRNYGPELIDLVSA